MTTTTAIVLEQILEGVSELLEVVRNYRTESRIRSSMHTLYITDNDNSENLMTAVDALEGGPIADMIKHYPDIDSVKISGLGALIGLSSGTVNVTITYVRSR